jgi:hypothetical protein
MPRVILEDVQGRNLELLEPEIDQVHSSLGTVLGLGILQVREEAAKAKECQARLDAAKANPEEGGVIYFDFDATSAIATVIVEREKHEMHLENDPRLPADQLLPADERQVLTGLYELLHHISAEERSSAEYREQILQAAALEASAYS